MGKGDLFSIYTEYLVIEADKVVRGYSVNLGAPFNWRSGDTIPSPFFATLRCKSPTTY